MQTVSNVKYFVQFSDNTSIIGVVKMQAVKKGQVLSLMVIIVTLHK